MGKRHKCAKCGSMSRFSGRCFECGDYFCYDHLYCLQYNPKRMKETDVVRDICPDCKKKFNYKNIRGVD